MSSQSVPVYDLTLTQLSADGKTAGLELPTIQRPGASAKDLRKLLKAAATLAPTVVYPVVPSIRVAGPNGQSVVNLKEGRLQYVSWGAAQVSEVNPSVDQIVAAITGEELEPDTGFDDTPAAAAGPGGSKRMQRMLLGALLVVAIVGLNTFSIWEAKRPPGNFLPDYRLLSPEPAERLLGSVAGAYETGGQPGDRRLVIAKDGNVQWIKFGPARAAAERRDLTVKPVAVSGGEGLLTSRNALIRIKDPVTVVMFGDTYTRVKQ
jgi:hypothetical protein